MGSKSFCGDDDLLEVINEKHTNMLSTNHNFYLSIHVQGWSGYVAILNGPIYLNLMKSFWKYASISSDDS